LASSNTSPNVPPMGLRFRMKASFSCASYSTEVQVICTALKKYGMFVADNGSDWYISGAPDPRWSDDRLGDLKGITGDAFEVVSTGQRSSRTSRTATTTATGTRTTPSCRSAPAAATLAGATDGRAIWCRAGFSRTP
jgi:hypothetical protein